MSCSPYDLRDYLFDELAPSERTDVRAHLAACQSCEAELESLRLTQSALLTIRDEEIPQRIGFVSDKVFEPSPFRRWLSGFWLSASRIGFVSAAMLSAAIFTLALRPNVHNNAQPNAQTVAMTQAELDRRIEAAVNARVTQAVDAAVAKAVSDSEDRAQKRTNEILAASAKRVAAEQDENKELKAELWYRHSVGQAAMYSANYRSPLQ
jgi:anti-sigma factor RsiW